MRRHMKRGGAILSPTELPKDVVGLVLILKLYLSYTKLYQVIQRQAPASSLIRKTGKGPTGER